MDLIKEKALRVDNYTLYEYLSGQIDKDKLNEEVATYKPKPESPKWIYAKAPNVDWINPNKQCVYKKPWIRERCIYCNEIKKYQWDKQCIAYKEKENQETKE